MPRAGLSETHSASHLTGQQPGEPAESSWQPHAEQATQPVPAGTSPTTPPPEPPTQQMARGPYDTGQQPAVHAPPQHTVPYGAAEHGSHPIAQSGDQPEHQAADWSPRRDPYEDVPPARSRALAHVLSLLLTLVLAPVTMLCVAVVQRRLATQHQRLLAEGGSYTFGILAALLGAVLLVVVLALLARWSSLGAIVVGALTLGLGLAAVVAPALQTAGWVQATIDALNRFLSSLELGQTMLHLLATGQLAFYGLALLLVGLVSHSSRRAGRAEGRATLQREHAAR